MDNSLVFQHGRVRCSTVRGRGGVKTAQDREGRCGMKGGVHPVEKTRWKEKRNKVK
jgi:hypothetical protein